MTRRRPNVSAPADGPLLAIDDLVVRYPADRPRHAPEATAVDGVSLRLERGETLGLVGESGSGKSTVARTVVGLVTPTAGRIVFDGQDITRADRRTRRALSARIQYVFQDPYGSLNPTRTVGDTLAEPLLAKGRRDRTKRERRISEILELVHLPGDAAARYPGAFSGGQRQRIAIARALVASPDLIICDEPTSALDVSIQAQILTLLKDLQARFHIGYLFIAHNLDVVRYMADRTAVMHHGRIVEHGTAERIATAPRHPYTRALVDAAPVPDPAAQAVRRAAREAAVELPPPG